MDKIDSFLNDKYNLATQNLGDSDIITGNSLSDTTKESLDIILTKSEKSKGVMTVALTSLVYKILHPAQDVRRHQANMNGGYSGRSFDSRYITPFMKEKEFPAMAESGWLTRSLEQNLPYDFDYPGKISGKGLKEAFLAFIAQINELPTEQLSDVLDYILQYLILQRNKFDIQLARPIALSVSDVVRLLDKHFSSTYSADGRSRLPTLAFYAIYQALIKELKRFQNKSLLSLENHTSADKRSGRIGDVDIVDDRGRAFEAVEIKHGIELTAQLVSDSYKKFSKTPVQRFYILSTAPIKAGEQVNLDAEIEKVAKVHGCQVIVNGVIASLKYYLRLLESTLDFIENYVALIENDSAIKYEHKLRWNELVSELGKNGD